MCTSVTCTAVHISACGSQIWQIHVTHVHISREIYQMTDLHARCVYISSVMSDLCIFQYKYVYLSIQMYASDMYINLLGLCVMSDYHTERCISLLSWAICVSVSTNVCICQYQCVHLTCIWICYVHVSCLTTTRRDVYLFCRSWAMCVSVKTSDVCIDVFWQRYIYLFWQIYISLTWEISVNTNVYIWQLYLWVTYMCHVWVPHVEMCIFVMKDVGMSILS